MGSRYSKGMKRVIAGGLITGVASIGAGAYESIAADIANESTHEVGSLFATTSDPNTKQNILRVHGELNRHTQDLSDRVHYLRILGYGALGLTVSFVAGAEMMNTANSRCQEDEFPQEERPAPVSV